MDAWATLVLAVLAGAFIALGAVFSTTVLAGTADAVPFGVARLLAGVVFCLGLVLVTVGGAELFTGNTLIVMAWASGKLPLGRLLRNWSIVFTGNLVGALATAGIVSRRRPLCVWRRGGGRQCAVDRAREGLLRLHAGGGARNVVQRARLPGGVADVVCAQHDRSHTRGRPQEFWLAIAQTPEQYDALTWGAFVYSNLVPVTLGNIIGGAVMVGATYWFVYLRPRRGRETGTS